MYTSININARISIVCTLNMSSTNVTVLAFTNVTVLVTTNLDVGFTVS